MEVFGLGFLFGDFVAQGFDAGVVGAGVAVDVVACYAGLSEEFVQQSCVAL